MKHRTATRTASEARTPRGKRDSGRSSVDDVQARIFDAIVDHRLVPGTKLQEERLAGVLGTTRARVREALTRLAQQRLVTLQRYRGACVAQPSVSETRDVLAARRVIEVATVREAARHATPEQIETLEACIAQAQEATRAGDRRRAIGLSRRFHLEIAQISGNAVLAEMLRGIISRVSLSIALYDRTGTSFCFFDEHVSILQAIANHDEANAAELIESHFQHMEDHLDLMQDDDGPRDLYEVFHGHD